MAPQQLGEEDIVDFQSGVVAWWNHRLEADCLFRMSAKPRRFLDCSLICGLQHTHITDPVWATRSFALGPSASTTPGLACAAWVWTVEW